MRVANFQIPSFISGDMSGSLLSSAISVYQIYGWSAQFVFSGSPVGTLSVEVSDDAYQNMDNAPQTPTNWTVLANSSQSISAAGDITYNVNLAFYNWVRFRYTFSSGTGTINGRINLKGV